MREYVITCDICDKHLQGSGCAELTTALDSVTIKLIWNDEEINYDLCSKCRERMERYLKKEAKRDKQ